MDKDKKNGFHRKLYLQDISFKISCIFLLQEYTQFLQMD